MTNRTKNTLSLLAIPFALLAIGLMINTSWGSPKPKAKPKPRTYAEAGVDLQRGLGPGMKSQGYRFAVRACLHLKGSKFVCAANIAGNEMGTGQCALITFTDPSPSSIEVSKVTQADDPKVCQ